MQTVITNTNYTKTVSLLKTEYDKLSTDGCFFALVRTEYDERGNVIHDFNVETIVKHYKMDSKISKFVSVVDIAEKEYTLDPAAYFDNEIIINDAECVKRRSPIFI